MIKELKPAVILLLLLTLLGGVIYPLLITGVAQMNHKGAHGSLIEREGVVVGSALVGQYFAAERYFWGRPSSLDTVGMGPGSPEYAKVVAARVKKIQVNETSVPMDLVTASASGLDPHISPDAALYQISRVAKARGMDVDALTVLVKEHTRGKWLGVFGQERVNVLKLNIALDQAVTVVPAKAGTLN